MLEISTFREFMLVAAHFAKPFALLGVMYIIIAILHLRVREEDEVS